MGCACCGSKLNSGMLTKIDFNTGQKFKSCPHCSAANGRSMCFIHILLNLAKLLLV